MEIVAYAFNEFDQGGNAEICTSNPIYIELLEDEQIQEKHFFTKDQTFLGMASFAYQPKEVLFIYF